MQRSYLQKELGQLATTSIWLWKGKGMTDEFELIGLL